MRLGKTQLALLLIIDQATRKTSTGELVGRGFVWEESIRYTRLDGAHDDIYMMRQDLRSLDRLVTLGFVDRRVSGYSAMYTVTDSGRRQLAKMR
jgi:hypothetical protein